MKKILITGGTGFLGSYLVHSLLENNYQVILLKRSTSNTWRIDDVLDKIKWYDTDHDNIEPAFREQHIDIIIHTACSYGRNNEKLSHIIDTNVMFGIKLLECAAFFNTDTFFNLDNLYRFGSSVNLEKNRDFVKTYLVGKGFGLIGRFGEWDYLWSDQGYMSRKNKANIIP